jgi:hypothetical protein
VLHERVVPEVERLAHDLRGLVDPALARSEIVRFEAEMIEASSVGRSAASSALSRWPICM